MRQAPRRFGADYQEEITLSDGTQATVRPVRPEDKDLFLKGFSELSTKSRYRRFHAAKTSLSPAELKYLTELDLEDHFALGAMIEGKGVGVARFIRVKDAPDTAEAAIVVVDRVQGKGLGRALLERLVAAALERGIRRFQCEVLLENGPMRALLAQLAPHAVERPDGEAVKVQVPLAPTIQRAPLRELFALAAQGLLRVLGLDRTLNA